MITFIYIIQNNPKAKPNFAADKQREAGKKMQPKTREYTQPSLKPTTVTSKSRPISTQTNRSEPLRASE